MKYDVQKRKETTTIVIVLESGTGLQYPELLKTEKVELPLYYFNRNTMKLFRMKPTEAWLIKFFLMP